MAVRTVLYSEDRAAGGFEVPGSCLFDKDINQTLQWTKGADGNKKKFTISLWCRTTQPGTRGVLIGCTNNGVGSNEDGIEIDGTPVRFYSYVGGSFRFQLTTTKKFRDTGWYHIVAMLDTAQATDSDRAKIWINGELQTDLATATYPSQGAQAGYMNTSGQIQYIGSILTSHYWDGHIAQHHFIDGASLDASYFGYTDELTGIWRPKKYNYKTAGDITSTSYAIKSSEQSSDGQIATNAFDREYDDAYADRWRNNGSEDGNLVNNTYIGQDFGSGNGKEIREVRLLQGRAGGTGEMVTGVKIQYSDNGSSWSDATASTTIDASTFAWQTIKAGPSGVHRYWRLLCTASSNSVWCVTELTMHEVSSSPAYGTYGWYLPCDGSAPLGSDQSGNNLDFISYNFAGSTTIDKATGALPILKTVNGGTEGTVGVRTDPGAPGKLILALPCVGLAVTDVSPQLNGGTTAYPITVTGAKVASNTSNHVTPNYYRDCLSFDGTGDRVRLNNANFVFGTKDFTIEAWVYKTNTDSEMIFSQIDDTALGRAGVILAYQSGKMWILQGDGSSWPLETTVGVFPLNTWVHVAVCRDYSATKTWYYINGEPVYTYTSNVNLAADNSGDMIIGNGGLTAETYCWTGFIQDFRVYDNYCKYDGEYFTPGSAIPGIIHDSPSGYPRTTELAPKKFGGGVGFGPWVSETGPILTGSASELNITSDTQTFTIEAWINPISIQPQSPAHDYRFTSIVSQGQVYLSFGYTDTGVLRWYTYDGSAHYINSHAKLIELGTWQHVAVVSNSGAIKLYHNGIEVGSGTLQDPNGGQSDGIHIGNADLSFQSDAYLGFISNLRVTSTAVYTAAFTPSSEPLTSITGTKLLCCQDPESPTAAQTKSGALSSAGHISPNPNNPFDDDINIVQGEASNHPTINDNEPWYNLTIKAGALRVVSDSNDRHVLVNFRMPEWVKWYWEMKAETVNSAGYLATGLYYRTGSLGASAIATAQGRYITASGNKGGAGSSSSSYGGGYDDGDWISIAVDMDAGKIFAAINGRWCEASNPVTGANAMYDDLRTAYDDMDWYPTCQNWQNGNVGFFNFGQRPFRYTPPKGYQPLSTNALGSQKNSANREPGVPRSDSAFKLLNYSGTGSTQRITGAEFQPDLVMLKKYSGGSDRSWQTYDSVRGATKMFHNDSNDDEQTQGAGLTSFNRDGFTVSTDDGVNGSTSSPKYLGYCWKAGGNKGTWNIDDVAYASAAAAGLTNTTAASVSTKNGFAILKYAGQNTNFTINHGLGRVPKFIITKKIDGNDNWVVHHGSLSTSNQLYVDLTNGAESNSNIYHSDPTSTAIPMGNWSNGKNLMSYVWAEVPGLSKFGEYAGNNLDRGIFTNIGFRPELLIIKKSSGAENWCIMHNATAMNDFATGCMCDHHLRWDNNSMDNTPGGSTPVAIDLLSNGFVHRDNSPQVNDGGTFVYMAWSKSPLNNLYGGQAIAR